MDAGNRTLGSISAASYLCMCIHICTCYGMVVGSEENTVEPESPSTMETQQWNSGFSQLQAAFLAEPSFWLLAIIY